MAQLRKIGANVFIVAFLLIIAIDGIPSLGLFHDRAKSAIDPILDITGIWQGGWSVFAPSVDKKNHRIDVRIEYSDGTTVQWSTPVWKELSALDKMLRFRELEFSEQLNPESNESIRPEFARYLSNQLRPSESVEPTHIVITYAVSRIALPLQGDHQPLPPRVESPLEEIIYEEPSS